MNTGRRGLNLSISLPIPPIQAQQSQSMEYSTPMEESETPNGLLIRELSIDVPRLPLVKSFSMQLRSQESFTEKDIIDVLSAEMESHLTTEESQLMTEESHLMTEDMIWEPCGNTDRWKNLSPPPIMINFQSISGIGVY